MDPPDKDLLVKGLDSTRYLFFTGKGGNGKTSLACSTAFTLAQRFGKKVLLVSTDPASNLDEVLGEPLSKSAENPTQVAAVDNLWAANIDPDQSATIYREKVLGDMRERQEPPEVIERVAEQLAGQCTVEIAAFDEFAGLLSCTELPGGQTVDHVVFDTAPTGHTLRLLALPAAWTNFFEGNQQGASCLGPVSALKMQKSRFERALASLKDATNTTVYLVSRPERRSIAECQRTWKELLELEIKNQRVIVNGVLPDAGGAEEKDPLARAMLEQQKEALSSVGADFKSLIAGQVPLRPFNVVGLDRLRSLLLPPEADAASTAADVDAAPVDCLPLQGLVQEVEAGGSGLVMVMGKGGVGKTTLAVALALALVERGCSVHLSTTDPAAHVQATLNSDMKMPNLSVSCVDPAAVTQKYIDEAVASRGPLDEKAKALLLEDLNSPCTEEIAVFEAFSELIGEAQKPDHFVVLDTAPTGHTLLLMDATGAYDREVQKKVDGAATPLHLLRDKSLTKVILATLPETTPISEAMRLRDDLGRAGIVPYAWVLNQCLPASEGSAILAARAALQRQQVTRLAGQHVFQAPRLPEEPIGPTLLKKLMAEGTGAQTTSSGPQAPAKDLAKIESVDSFFEKRASKEHATAVLFDASWVKDDLRIFARWLSAQVAEDRVFSLDAEDDDLDDAVGEDMVTELPSLCFYADGKLIAKHTDIVGAKQAAGAVMQVPEAWLESFSLEAARAGGAKKPKTSSTPAIALPSDLRRAGVIGGC